MSICTNESTTKIAKINSRELKICKQFRSNSWKYLYAKIWRIQVLYFIQHTCTWLFSRWFYFLEFHESVLAKISTSIHGYLYVVMKTCEQRFAVTPCILSWESDGGMSGPFQGHHHSLKKEYTWCNHKPSLVYMYIFSLHHGNLQRLHNENITKITKLSHHKFAHLVQNREDICTWSIWRIQYMFECSCAQATIYTIKWNLVIKRSDITIPSYNKVILLVPALYISLFFDPDITR